jgi:NTE family protein
MAIFHGIKSCRRKRFALTGRGHNFTFLFSVVFLFSLVSGCAHYPLNQPLDPAQQAGRYDFRSFDREADGNGAFVVLTFSGGGSRAAALSYGALNKLRETGLPGSAGRVLDKVNVISTVSGGSFTGAYYALFGDRIFADFKEKFLYRNIQQEIGQDYLKIANFIRVLSPNYGRSNLAAELYDESIFDHGTFGALVGKGKPPFLIINATNMVTGIPFEFTSSQFDYIGSDLLSWPVAQAVAASSAFPFLLSPISLKNYADPSTFRISEDDREAMKDYWKNKRRYYTAKSNLAYVNSQERPFVHLLDGGVADNLGLRAVYNLFEKKEMREKMETDRIKRLLVIIVNARTDPNETIEKDESTPGIFTVGKKTFTIPMENYTFETIELFRSMLREKTGAREAAVACQRQIDTQCNNSCRIAEPKGGVMRLYIAEISFDSLKDKNEKAYFNNLPTSFALEKEQVDRLIEVGGRLLAENPSFKKFLEEYDLD